MRRALFGYRSRGCVGAYYMMRVPINRGRDITMARKREIHKQLAKPVLIYILFVEIIIEEGIAEWPLRRKSFPFAFKRCHGIRDITALYFNRKHVDVSWIDAEAPSL